MIPSKFKDIHTGKTAILFATGPTLNKFDYDLIPEKPEELIKVGVNSMIYKDDFALDYYFCAHDVAKEPETHPHKNFEIPFFKKVKERCKDLQVFCASTVDGKPNGQFFTPSEIEEFSAVSYALHTGDVFYKDIGESPLYNHSIVFPALQLLLYSGIHKIYIVGCDVGGGYSFLVEDIGWCTGAVVTMWRRWKDFKQFRDTEYPHVKIVSVNPRKLEGLFEESVFN